MNEEQVGYLVPYQVDRLPIISPHGFDVNCPQFVIKAIDNSCVSRPLSYKELYIIVKNMLRVNGFDEYATFYFFDGRCILLPSYIEPEIMLEKVIEEWLNE